MYRTVLNEMIVPRAELLITHVKGLEGDLELVPKKECTEETLLAAYAVPVMIKAWLGAAYTALSLYFCIYWLVEPSFTLTLSFAQYQVAHFSCSTVVKLLKCTPALPNRAPINHAPLHIDLFFCGCPAHWTATVFWSTLICPLRSCGAMWSTAGLLRAQRPQCQCEGAESPQQRSLVIFNARLSLQVHNCDHSSLGELELPNERLRHTWMDVCRCSSAVVYL